MDELPFLFAALVALAAVLGAIGIGSRRRLWIKLTALATVLLFVPSAYAGLAALLSKPKPVALEWLRASRTEASVIGATIEPGRAIYLWLKLDGVAEPRAYALPWSRELAQELQEAMREAERNGSGLKMRAPFEPSLDYDEPKFYALPQPRLPPKGEGPGEEPQTYRHPSFDV